MSHWNHPPDMHYSFKSHFNWPPPPVSGGAAAAGAAEAATTALPHATPVGSGGYRGGPWARGYHGHGFGRGYYYRPRFGIFRRMVWFGLGVGVASWYLHHNDPVSRAERGMFERTARTPSCPLGTSKPDNRAPSWRSHWQYSHPTKTVETPILASTHMPKAETTNSAPTESRVLASLPALETSKEEEKPRQWGWGARREQRRQRRAEAAASAKVKAAGEHTAEAAGAEKEEVKEIRELVDKLWAERKQAAVDLQVQANEKAKEYARSKLETLSKAVETLRDALDADAEKAAKDRKLV